MKLGKYQHLGLFACISLLIFFAVQVPVFAQTETPMPTPTPTGCWDPAPGGSVELKTASPSGTHDITLTWTEATDPVSYYLLSYGLAAGQYIYGNPNIGGQGTTTYTVGGLTTGKKYYFVVRAGNGCTPGTFSDELSAIAGEIPTPTPQPEADRPLDETPTPEIPTPTPTPTPIPEVLAAESTPPTGSSNSFVSHIMLGATAFGVVCAVIGAFLWLRMKKRHS
jgi:hypothetical protein